MPYSIIPFLFLVASFFAPAARAQNTRFITVEGADLRAKYDAAIQRGNNASPQTRFWTAHSFDVRPGVAVDLEMGEFHGSMSTYGDTTVFFGRVGSGGGGVGVETRNLGVFVLHEPGGGGI